MNVVPVRRALVSTFEKDGILELARGLHAAGVEILSTGGTAQLLTTAGVPVVKVSDHTGFPEILDGRVKTLHPKIHGGLLGIRSNPVHVAEMAAHGIAPIDLLVVNLYPFERTAARPGASYDDVVEMIDIGGPAMLRAASKNHACVGVLVDPADYPGALAEIEAGGLTEPTRRRLAAKAFDHTARYDAAVAAYLAGPLAGFPERLDLGFVKAFELVYGENPHQKAAFYRDPEPSPATVASAVQLQGKALSFNNILDFDGALALAADLAKLGEDAGCAIVKHGNPCGVGLGPDAATSFSRALACDPVSAFGGVIAFTLPVGAGAASKIAEAFYEGVIAPSFDDDALAILSKKKNLRLLAAGDLASYRRPGQDLRRVAGGLLVQEWDGADSPLREARVVTKRAPTEDEWRALILAWAVVRHVKSNAIVYAGVDRTLGIGAGQMSRVDAARFGIEKAQAPLRGAAMASDAFFPFRDGLDVAAEAGVTAVVQPGGSIRDEEVIAAADERGLAMVLAGRRHFRH
jgi:phosphoribosylaminoimidazolecarboxamide formyltransferase/IMP cyclohydrolase